MKKTFNIGTRLVAWLLVFVMVLGYIPVGALADDETTTGDSTPAEVTTGVSSKNLLTVAVSAAAEGGEEGTEGAANPYVVAVSDSKGTDVTDECNIEWKDSTATITYQCMEMEVNCADAVNTSVSLKVSIADAKATLGAQYAPDGVEITGGKITDDDAWTYELYADYFSDGVATKETSAAVQLGAYTLKYTNEAGETVTVAELPINGTISAATFTAYDLVAVDAEVENPNWDSDQVTVVAADATTWFAKAQKVRVSAYTNAELTNIKYLPEASVTTSDGESTPINWEKDADAPLKYTAVVPIYATSTIAFGSIVATVGIDDVTPEITGASACVNGNDIVVHATYTVGDSGIASVDIAGDNISPNANVEVNDDGQFVIKDVQANRITSIIITNGAGVSSEAYAPDGAVAVTPALAATLDFEGIVGEKDGKTYIDKDNGATLTITVANACGDVAVKVNEEDVAPVDGVYSYAITGDTTINNVTVKDHRGIVTEPINKTYVIDKDAPDVIITPDVNNEGVVYSQDELTYNIEISDAYLVIEEGSAASIKIEYIKNNAETPTEKQAHLNEKSGKYEAKIEVANGETLNKITVNATDNSGNKAAKTVSPNVTVDTERPHIEIDASDIEAFYTDSYGNVFAKVNPVSVMPGDTKDVEVAITVNITDENLPDTIDEAWDGWSFAVDDDGNELKDTITRTFPATVKENDTGTTLELTIPAIKDKAGWVPSETDEAGFATLNVSADVDNDELDSRVAMNYDEENESYSLKLYFDRRAPSSDGAAAIPKVKLDEDTNNQKSKNGTFTGNGATFYLTVTDDLNDLIGSGIVPLDNASVNIIGGERKVAHELTWDSNEGKYKLVLTWNSDEVELNNVNIIITVKDYLGNTYTYSSDPFAIDNAGPDVTVSYDQNNSEDAVNGEYYNRDRKLTVTVKDASFTDAKTVAACTSVKINGKEAAANADVWSNEAEDGVWKFTYTFNVDGYYEVDITCKDTNEKGGNFTNNGSHIDAFYIDKTYPEITVTKTVAEDKGLKNTFNNIDYYDGEVTYTFSVADEHIYEWTVSTQSPCGVNFDEEANTYSIVVTNGQTLSDIKITAIDKAGNSGNVVDENRNIIAEKLTVEDKDNNPENDDVKTAFEYDETEKIWNYTGNNIIVDTEAPVITVTKSMVEDADGNIGSYKNTYGVNDYYDGAVQYTVKVTDEDMEIAAGSIAKAEIKVTYLNAATDAEYIPLEVQDDGSYLCTVTLNDGDAIAAIQLNIADNAGNSGNGIDDEGNNVEKLTVADADNDPENGDVKTAFEYDETEKIWNYTGNNVIVDMTAPSATLTFSDNVAYVYQNTATGYVYVELKDPVKVEDGDIVEDKVTDKAEVSLTIAVTDKNLATDAEKYNVVVDYRNAADDTDFHWIAGTEDAVHVNTESNLEYVYTVSDIAPNQATLIVYKVTVYDLAGHALDKDHVEVKNVEDGKDTEDPADDRTSTYTIEFAKDGEDEIEGCITNTISIDRRPAASVAGDNCPVKIELIPAAPYTNIDGGELFNNGFNFMMDVSDIYFETVIENNEEKQVIVEEKTSGIRSIKWQITDTNPNTPVVTDVPGTWHEVTYYAYTPEILEFEQIVVKLKENTKGESNTVTLTVKVEDNAGNVVTLVKVFGVDNLAPRVDVVFTNTDNNAPHNTKYFQGERTATITVTDLNFSDAGSIITTSGKLDNADIIVTRSAWAQSGENQWQSVINYKADGEYTLSMTCKDLANNSVNETEEGGVDVSEGDANACPTGFVIDNTAPVITVTYNPTVPVDKDNMGVWYFDRNRNMTATINERNFNAADIKATLENTTGALTWNDGTNHNHVATYNFAEGNNYGVSIEYTDLAGNPAEQSYKSETFSVDTHEPTIEVTKGNMTNSALNIVQGDLSLAFTINDAQNNLKDYSVNVIHLDNEFNQTEVKGAEYYVCTMTENRTTVVVDFANIAAEKGNDGIYYVRISAQDYAGHYVSLSPEMNISLNRFGSTFKTDDPDTQDFLTPNYNGSIYKQSVSKPLVITEINPNKVWQDANKTEEGSLITIAVNGKTYALKNGTDYKLNTNQKGTGSNKYYVYTYSINPSVFTEAFALVNGQYSLLFYSEDEAGNKNTNETNLDGSIAQDSEGNYSGKVSFTLDDQEPVVTVIGITDDQRIQAANQRVEIITSDNTPVVGIQVYVDDVLVQQYDSMDGLSESENWLCYDEETGTYILNLAQKGSGQNIHIVATDAAGNEGFRDVKNVLINASGFVQFIHSIWLPIVIGLLVLILLFLIILSKKHKKNKDEVQA